jgi:hypothetical protein
MLNFVLLGLGAAVLGVLAIAARKPDQFRIERSIRIAAAPDRILPWLVDYRRWAAWSPYEKKDPDMQRTFSGAESGVGAQYAWAGDKNIGSGRMQIVEVTPSRVVIDMEFLTPMKAHNTAEFVLTPDDDGTQLTWAMFGPQPFSGKLVSVVMNIDKMVGGDFAAGLSSLKALVEAPSGQENV